MTPGGPFPTIGRIVHYRSNTGRYTCAAIVTATVDSLDPAGVAAGDVPALDSVWDVHLNVHTPGAQVVYQEHGVPFDNGDAHEEHKPGTWRWPPRA